MFRVREAPTKFESRTAGPIWGWRCQQEGLEPKTSPTSVLQPILIWFYIQMYIKIFLIIWISKHKISYIISCEKVNVNIEFCTTLLVPCKKLKNCRVGRFEGWEKRLKERKFWLSVSKVADNISAPYFHSPHDLCLFK